MTSQDGERGGEWFEFWGLVFPYISHIGMCCPQRVWFLHHSGLKTVIDFAHFGLESRMVFEETTGVYGRIYLYLSFQFLGQMNIKRKKKCANSK